MATRRRYYTPTEVAGHCTAADCWLSWNSKVYDLTNLITKFDGEDAVKPIVEVAGTDISSWFEEGTGDLKSCHDPQTGLDGVAWCTVRKDPPQAKEEVQQYFPNPFVHVPPNKPSSNWRNDFGPPWWKDSSYCIGNLTKKTRKVTIVNTLSHQEHTIEVCSEETIHEIVQRYLECNNNALKYVWKRMGENLDMNKTLEENGVPDESKEFAQLGLDESFYIPKIHVYYTDDRVSLQDIQL